MQNQKFSLTRLGHNLLERTIANIHRDLVLGRLEKFRYMLKDRGVHSGKAANAAAALGRAQIFGKLCRTIGISISGNLSDDTLSSKVPQNTSN